jgi:2-polyprenyl-3-methyl-5-hydroxy-6-metoxy-1,4-benzoquinol methylase
MTSITKVKKYWNSNPCNIKHSDKKFLSKNYFNEVDKKKFFVERHLKKFAQIKNFKNKNILEVGCGIGTMASYFAKKGANYTGIDLSDKSVRITKKRFELLKLKGNIFQANCEELSKCFEKGIKFDLIFSFGVIHHTPNISKAINEMRKLMNKNSILKIMIYSKNSYKNFLISEKLERFERKDNVPIANTYSIDETKKLFKNFKIIEIKKDHIFPYQIKYYKKHIYKKLPWFEKMPEKIFKILEKNIGWHTLITLKKGH